MQLILYFHSAYYFYLQQLIYRKIQVLGLITKYHNVLKFTIFFPPEKVKEVWGIFKS